MALTAWRAEAAERLVGEDWPTRMHDVYRSGITAEQLAVPLTPEWTYTTARPPAPAWTESPAKSDYLHNWYDLKPRQHFDRCFDVAVAGSRLYFGSSVSGAVTCLDIATGETVWTFFTSAPVRFAPHVADGRVYVGSDDGFVYCLRAEDGALVWSERAGPGDDMIWGNQHMISVWPVRTSVLVDGGEIYWTSGVFPEEGIFFCKRAAADGAGGWVKPGVAPPQGYLVALPDRIIVPGGKSFPRLYSRDTGESVGAINYDGRDGGCWAVISPDLEEVWFGPSAANEAQAFSMRSMARLAAMPGANCLIVDATHSYYCTDTQLIQVDRDSRAEVWSQPYAYPYALIKSGAVLFAGGDGEVAAFDTEGRRIWQAPVDGNAYGLAVARGRLFVSTDTGNIHCFRATLPQLGDAVYASAITPASAIVHGALAASGGSACRVHLFWGEEDGGAHPEAWDHERDLGICNAGPLEAQVKDLAPDKTCTFRFCAVNEEGQRVWSPAAGRFITGAVTLRTVRAATAEQGGRPALVTVSRPASASAEALTVQYEVAGTAGPGADYEALPGTVTIPAGEADVAISIKAYDDLALGEQDETIVLSLAEGPYVTGGASPATVTIQDPGGLERWACSMDIRVGETGSDEVLHDFPLLIALDPAIPGFAYSQFAANEGGDLRFTDEAGTRFLHHEIEQWNTAGASYVWVCVPELAASGTVIRAHWGNKAATALSEADTHGTWAHGFAGVWHFGESQGGYADSTDSANHGEPSGNMARLSDGIVGGTAAFSGDKAYVTLSSPLAVGSTSNTVSAWVRVPKAGSGGLEPGERAGILLGNFNQSPNVNWEVHADGRMRTFWNNGQVDERAVTDLRTDTWRLIAWVRDKDAGGFRLYIDGLPETSVDRPGSDVALATCHRIGGDNRTGTCPCFHGQVDELRVSAVARSEAWLRACWLNQHPESGLVSFGPVKALGTGVM